MKKFTLGSFSMLLLASVVTFGAGSNAQAEISDLRIHFKGGCQEENLTGACHIRISASGFDFDPQDRVALYASSGPNEPMRRISNHWRYVSDRGTTVANIKNIPGACFQVRTWTQRDEESLRFHRNNRRAGSRYDVDNIPANQYTMRGKYYRIDRSRADRPRSADIVGTRDARVSSNIICEPRGSTSSAE